MTKHLIPFEPGTDDYSVLRCPQCSFNHVHIDDVYIAGRPREDDAILPVRVNSHGKVTTGVEITVPFGALGAGRRHTITLVGWCEGCSERIAIVLQQHKGQTLVSTLTQTWQPVGVDMAASRD